MVLTWNDEPSQVLGIPGTSILSTPRVKGSGTFSQSARFQQLARNGDCSLLPPGCRSTPVDTSTHTRFKHYFYDPPTPLASSCRAQRSAAMRSAAPRLMDSPALLADDTRLRYYSPPYSTNLGPGSYSVDPLGWSATGPLTLSSTKGGQAKGRQRPRSAAGEYEAKAREQQGKLMYREGGGAPIRDPRRPSCAFRARQRGQVPIGRGRGLEANMQLIFYRSNLPDYGVWHQKGSYAPHQTRTISPETWGASARAPRDPYLTPPVHYLPHLTKEGRPASCGAVLDRGRTAWGAPGTVNLDSRYPRLTPLPLGRHVDLRSHPELESFRKQLGPGSYAQDVPHSLRPVHYMGAAAWAIAKGQEQVEANTAKIVELNRRMAAARRAG